MEHLPNLPTKHLYCPLPSSTLAIVLFLHTPPPPKTFLSRFNRDLVTLWSCIIMLIPLHDFEINLKSIN